jgi:hypothetical protein
MGKKVLLISFCIFLFACSSSKEKKKVSLKPKKENSHIEKDKVELIKLDSTNLKYASKNPIKSTFINETESGLTTGRILDKSKTSGCSFVILVNDSIVFEPVNLEDKYKTHGLKIIFGYRKSRAMTTCMMGQTIITTKVRPMKEH